MGFQVYTTHHEAAAGQHEINFQYADPLTTAFRVVTLKYVAKVIAVQHDLHATFMPKPLHGQNGTGMHTHMSLVGKDKWMCKDIFDVFPGVEEACKIMVISTPTGYRWINSWNKEGMEGLKNKQGKGGGKPPKLSKEGFEELERILRKEKDSWLTKEVVILIRERFGIIYSEAQVVRILKKLKMNHGKPFPHD